MRELDVGDVVIPRRGADREDPWLSPGSTWTVTTVHDYPARADRRVDLKLLGAHKHQIQGVDATLLQLLDLPDALERDVLEEWLDAD